ncbi:AAA family ATPase [Halodesulfurarchaeum sp. HSR-GB]|uniref:adenylate kinase family protein n=1 Tax=Halodesulfurarchaeum sp. HSR-GB TaxID=3074077 RepID=UPI00285D4CAF|nr:AAA family ATPase [Halodesulfurarchaeum sp. HSR-GB]MDR5657335.1 AAA family ATPase [Halodesulfurarchaeum sp. HSR-GB]
MKVAVTGTPGTGKTTATKRVETDLEIVHLNEVIRNEGLHEGTDDDRGSLLADFDAIDEYLAGKSDFLVESHLAHHFDADRVVVLRCDPKTVEERLRERGESQASARENAESEALDVILSEAVTAHGEDAVYEIETTEQTPEETARAIEAVIAGDREPSAGTVDYTDYL